MRSVLGEETSLGIYNGCMALVPPLLVVQLLAASLVGQFGGSGAVTLQETAWSVSAGRVGDRLVLAVVLDIAEGYHINPDPSQVRPLGIVQPIPSQLQVAHVPPELLFETPKYYPAPHEIQVQYFNELLLCYEGQLVIYLPVKIAPTAVSGKYSIKLEFTYQACTESQCYLKTSLAIPVTLNVVARTEAVAPANSDWFVDLPTEEAGPESVRFDIFGLRFHLVPSTWSGFGLLLLVAGIGGLLLNFTPCVLPVVPLKILGISQVAGNRGRCLALGIAMAMGVMAFWVFLGALIAVASGFTAANQLFQYPAFTIGVGSVIAVMAVGMCGVFTMRLPQFVYRISPKHDTLAGSFGFGIMTAVLSAPCTAPFMGTAAAWGATRLPVVTVGTFTVIGLGMALPYLVLSAVPSLVARVPRSGPASELLKQVMGLLMLAAAAYFVGVGLSGLWMQAPDPPSRFYWWPVALFVAAAASWLICRVWQLAQSTTGTAVGILLGLVGITGAFYGASRLSSIGPIDWIYYTPQRLDEALEHGNVVVMDFTAEWCINCTALEHAVLYRPDVASVLNGPGVVPMKVDLTGDNGPGRKKLHHSGRLMIPLLVIYAPDGTEVFKSDAYGPSQVLEAIAEATRHSTN